MRREARGNSRSEKSLSRKVSCLALGVLLLALSFSAEAQQTKKIPRIGYLSPADPASDSTRAGGNVTGLTNLTRELGGKRLELLKEAVPKLARIAVLYDPTAPSSGRELKEVLPVAARALGLTIQPWEVRDANGFEKVFAALNKQRPDGLYVAGGGPVMVTNQKR